MLGFHFIVQFSIPSSVLISLTSQISLSKLDIPILIPKRLSIPEQFVRILVSSMSGLAAVFLQH